MKKTLVLYETYYGTTRKAAQYFSKIAGNVKLLNVSDTLNDLSCYDNLVLFFAFHGYQTAFDIKEYLKSVKDQLKSKKVILFGVGLYKKDLENYCQDIEKSMGRDADRIGFIEGQLQVNELTASDKEVLSNFLGNHNMHLMDMGKLKLEEVCSLACSFRDILNEIDNKLDDFKLKSEIENYLEKHNTCTLATGYDDYVRATPIEYIYYKDNFYFITEGGYKFNGILQNSNVSIAIYDEYTGMNSLKGLQVTGQATLIEINSELYNKVMDYKGIKYANIPIDMNILEVKPLKFEFLNSDFKKLNADAKQIL